MIILTDDFPDPFDHWARGNQKVLSQRENVLDPDNQTAGQCNGSLDTGGHGWFAKITSHGNSILPSMCMS